MATGASVECMSSSFLAASDDSDGDAGLLSALLGPPSFGLAQHTSESSEFYFCSAVDSQPPLVSGMDRRSGVGSSTG